jgi:hypothetical protein
MEHQIDPVASVDELIARCIYRVLLSLEEGTEEIEIDDLYDELHAAIAQGVAQERR